MPRARGQARPRFDPKPRSESETGAVLRTWNVQARVVVDQFQGFPGVGIEFNKRFTMSLTSMTVDEVAALRAVLNALLDLVEPVAAAADQQALELYNDGEEDRDFSRLYRPAPFFTLNERLFAKHFESLPGGPERVAEMARRLQPIVVDRAGTPVRGVPEHVPGDGGGQDDAAPHGGDEGMG